MYSYVFLCNLMQDWVTTKDAVRILGIKRQTLKRKYANPDTGFLIEGIHWKHGMYQSSSKVWDINACKQTLLQQGYTFTKGAKEDTKVSQ